MNDFAQQMQKPALTPYAGNRSPSCSSAEIWRLRPRLQAEKKFFLMPPILPLEILSRRNASGAITDC